MRYSVWMRGAVRVVPWFAPVLLVLPAMVLVRGMARWTWEPRFAHLIDDYALPRVLLAIVSAAAALLYLLPNRRRFATGLASVAALVAVSVSIADAGAWQRFGPFGDESLGIDEDCAWGLAVLGVLALAPRQIGSLASSGTRAGVLGAAALVPSWLGPLAGILLVQFAWTKLEYLGTSCAQKYIDPDLGVGTAELWAGLLILVPSTRAFGLRLGTLLAQGFAVLGLREAVDRHSGGNFGYLADLYGPWWIHVTVAMGLALAMGAAFVRELKLRAVARCATYPHAAVRSNHPAIRTGFRALRRAHRATSARWFWAAPVAAVALFWVGAGLAYSAFYDVTSALVEAGERSLPRLVWPALIGFGPFVAATYLWRPYLRRDVVDPALASVRSASARIFRGRGDPRGHA